MKCICRHCGAEVEFDSELPIHCNECKRELQQKDLISTWNLKARVKQLAAMHELMCQANDEYIYMSWINLMPDGATEEDFKYIALDDEQYNECFDFFVKLIKKEGNRW